MLFFLTKKVNNTTGKDCGITHLVIFNVIYYLETNIYGGLYLLNFCFNKLPEADLLKFPEGCDLGNKVASKAGRKVGGKLRTLLDC